MNFLWSVLVILLSSGHVLNMIQSITLTSLMTFSLYYDLVQLDMRERGR